MEGIFNEFENENGIRSYPFSSGCHEADGEGLIPPGVFVDAILYPVNPVGTIYLSGISKEGSVEISDDTGAIMHGSVSGNAIEFRDTSPMKRHSGTLVASSVETLSEFIFRGNSRSYTKEETAFASGCVFPVELEGVTSVSIEGSDAVSGDICFSNGRSDRIRVSSGSSEDGKSTIRFDVITTPFQEDYSSIRRIICVVDGETPFRIGKLFDAKHPENYGYNTVVLTLDGIDRDSVCSAANRENALEMADTCECKQKLPEDRKIPDAYQLEEVFIPPDIDGSEGGVSQGSENAFFLVVPNLPGHVNPISVTLEDGSVSPRIEDIEVTVNGRSAEIDRSILNDSITSKGVVIQVPGINGGSL